MEDEKPYERYFTTYDDQDTRRTVVVFNPSFSVQDWGQLEAFFREKMDKYHLGWDLDLRWIPLVTSFFLGGLVGLNTILLHRGGSLHIIIERGSHSATIFRLSRLNKIIEISEVDPEPKLVAWSKSMLQSKASS